MSMEKTFYLMPDDEQNSVSRHLHRSSKNSFTMKGSVHFNCLEQESKKRLSRISIKAMTKKTHNSLPKRQVFKNKTVINNHFQTPLPQEQIAETLKRMKILRLPERDRRSNGENLKILTDLLNSPMLSKSSIIKEYKCLMSHGSVHQSYLISKRMGKQMKETLKQANNYEQYNFRYNQLAIFLTKVQQKRCDEILQAYENMLEAHTYPTSVELMILYMGVHVFSINGHYIKAEETCQRLFDLMIKRKVDICIPIFLIYMTKLQINQGHWKNCLSLLSRTLSASWIYNQQDLQIWAYFEFSRAHFALGNYDDCEFFKERSQMSYLQGKNTIFRDMMEHAYKKEIEMIRNHNYNYDMNFVITQIQLCKNPLRQKHSTNLKAQVYAKTIAQNFKIKHVKNLIGRLGQQFVRPIDNSCLAMAGNPQLLTHQSGLKNLNIYFRQGGEDKQFYTFENSFKNILILKQMVRNLLLEMKWYTPINQ